MHIFDLPRNKLFAHALMPVASLEAAMPGKIRFEHLAKLGYAARGIVFLLVAGLAFFQP